MNEEAMRKHYERTPKETLINILISSREEVEKLQKRNKECKQEIERLNNIKKEVREYVEKHIKYECDDAFNGKQFYSYHLYDFDKKELLEILDKE